MTSGPSPTERLTNKMTADMQSQSTRLVTKLQNEFSGPDRTSTSTANWHAVIRSNWDDPAWRQEQAERMGDVPFAKDALSAFGIPHAALADYVPPAPPLPTGPHLNPGLPIPPEAQPTPTTQTAPGVSM